MAKSKLLIQELIKRAKAGDGLAMDYASRMARAKEGRFGDDTFYHVTGGDIEAFDNSRIGQTTDEGWFGRGHYFAPDPNYSNQFVPSTGNANTVPVKLRAENQYDWRANELDSNGRGMAIANDEMRQAKTDELINAGYSGVDVYDDVIKLPEGESLSQDQWKKIKDHYTEKFGSFPSWLKKETVENTLRRGAPKHTYVEQYGEDFVAALPQERILKERMVFDPSNIRSVNAQFDPAKSSSSNLLASGLAGTAIAGGMLAPQDAEAKGVGQLKRLVQLGFMDPAQAANPTQIKRATTAYNNALQSNPAFKARERQAMLGDYADDYENLDLGERLIIKPEDLQGKALVSVMGDRSNIGTVKSVGGIELPYGVDVEGGAGFPQRWQDEGLGWASELSIAEKKQNALRNAAGQSGKDVVGVYSAMGPDSINYSTPIAEIMMAQIPSMKKLRVRDKKMFDKEMRQAYPQWVGLDDPNAMGQLMGQAAEGVKPLPGKARTSFTTIMGKADYRNKGFPTYNDAVKVATNPDLANVNMGDSGYSMFHAKPEENVELFSGHKTYNAKIPGSYAGGFEESVPKEIMFPDAYLGQRARNNAAGKPFTHGQAMNAIGTRGDVHQVADQQWVDKVSGYLEKRKTAAGLLAATAGSAQAYNPQQDLSQLSVGNQYNNDTQPESTKPKGLGLTDYIKGGADIAGMLGHGLASESVKGLSMLGGMVSGMGVDKSVSAAEALSGKFPQYEIGPDALAMVSKAYDAYLSSPRADNAYLDPKAWLEQYMRMGDHWGDVAYDVTGSPAIATGVKSGLEVFQ